MAKPKTYFRKSEDQNPGKRTADANIRKNILMNEKAFEDLLGTHCFTSTLGYFGVCLIMTYLLMTLSLFSIYYFLDNTSIGLSLNYAIVDSLLGVLVIGTGFISFFVLPAHVASKLLGAKKSLVHTFQVHAYAFTPFFLVGWVWLLGGNGSVLEIALLAIGAVFSVFAIINGINGLKKIHGLSTFKAVVAAFIVPVAVLGLSIFIALKVYHG